MPSLRGTRHDSAKIDGGGSNPPGGTSAGREVSVTKSNLETWRPERVQVDPRLRALPACFTSRSGDQIGLQIRSRWVQFLGGVRIVRASARAAVWRDSRWIRSGLMARHFLASSFARARNTAGCSSDWQSARFGTERPVVQVHLPRRIDLLTWEHSFLCHHLPGNGPSMEGDRFDSTSMRHAGSFHASVSSTAELIPLSFLCPATGRR
jgi:hypothetical protein